MKKIFVLLALCTTALTLKASYSFDEIYNPPAEGAKHMQVQAAAEKQIIDVVLEKYDSNVIRVRLRPQNTYGNVPHGRITVDGTLAISFQDEYGTMDVFGFSITLWENQQEVYLTLPYPMPIQIVGIYGDYVSQSPAYDAYAIYNFENYLPSYTF